MDEYDYIITGCGASGLILAYRMVQDSFFDDKSILLIDIEKKTKDDRTWCYWEKGEGEWDSLLEKSWDKIWFKSDIYSKELTIKPYVYKMIRSSKLYEFLWAEITKHDNVTVIWDKVLNISHRSFNASVLTEQTEYYANNKIFNSIFFDRGYKHYIKSPYLQQHFRGWFIETEEDMFDDSSATFMDFTVNQKDNTRFMYVLPMSPRKALFEYTLFSKKVLSEREYEKEIERYLKKKNIKEYKIVEKEEGIIPMASYKFWKHNSKNVLNIGTTGGWTKASTGYTFRNITERTKDVIKFVKTDGSFKKFHKRNRYWWYDLLLLDVLSRENYLGSRFFSLLFKRNKVQRIFKFLDEETSIFQDIRIMLSMPSLKFTIALFRRIF